MSFKKFLPFLVAALLVTILIIAGCDELITESYTVTLVDSTLGATCTDCHDDSDNRYLRPTGQWQNSAHASSELLQRQVDLNDSMVFADDCGSQCHTHQGFVEWVDDSTINNQTSASVIGCFTCHTPHSGPFGTWDDKTLRGLGTDSLPNVTFLEGSIVYNAGKSNMCAICHQATGLAPQTSSNQDIDHEWGPHFSPQADAFWGTSGYLADETVDLSNPHRAVQDGCIGCHFGTGRGYDFGEHTFRLRNDDTGEEYYDNCEGCHGGVKSLDSLHTFYTGKHDSLIIYGDSLEVLLKTWGLLDPDDPTGHRFIPTNNVDGEMAQILYNYLFYRLDGSQGVHNPPYIYELLSTSLEKFTTKAPRADFTVSDTVICYGDSIYFYDNSSSMVGITDRCWYYSNLDSSCQDTAINPVHVFEFPGTYTVSLKVTDGNSSDSAAYPLSIVVMGPQAAIDIDTVAGVYNGADLDTVTGFAPLDVFFSDASQCTGPGTTWQWVFSDGDTITTQEPGGHVFDTIGLFSVTLTLEDPIDPLLHYTTTKYVSARGPQAAFSANWAFGFSPHEVQFTDESLSGDSIITWAWDFGDTATEADTSILQNPTYEYTHPGEYDVTLTVTSALGSDTHKEVGMIRIFKPSAVFSWDNNIGCAPLTVSFYNKSIDLGNVDTVAWYFGDGDSAIQTDRFDTTVIHTYDTADVFDVSLQLRGTWGQSERTRDNLVTSMGPDAGFAFDTTVEHCTGNEISFVSDTGGCDVDVHQWIFGNDTASSAADPLYSFSAIGSFLVEHIVTNAYGVRSDSQYIDITGPSAEFWVQDSIIEGCRPMTVTFINESPCPIDEWHWYFQDYTDTITTTNVVTHTYTAANYYEPTLAVLVDGNVMDSLKCNDRVRVLAVQAGFDVEETLVCLGDTVRFTDASECGAVTYRWTFGDDTESDEMNPTHVYTTAGTFEVIQTVWDGDDVVSSNVPRDTITVIDGLPILDFVVTPPVSGNMIGLEDNSTNAYTWDWSLMDAGDVTVATGSGKDVIMSAPGPGTYWIVLTVSNPCGEVSSDRVEVIVPE